MSVDELGFVSGLPALLQTGDGLSHHLSSRTLNYQTWEPLPGPSGFQAQRWGANPRAGCGARQHHPLQIYDFTRKPIHPPGLLAHLLTQFIRPEQAHVPTAEKELYFKIWAT